MLRVKDRHDGDAKHDGINQRSHDTLEYAPPPGGRDFFYLSFQRFRVFLFQSFKAFSVKKLPEVAHSVFRKLLVLCDSLPCRGMKVFKLARLRLSPFLFFKCLDAGDLFFLVDAVRDQPDKIIFAFTRSL